MHLVQAIPDMPAYKLWVNEFFVSLLQDWDDAALMKKAIERIRDEEILDRAP